MRIDILVNIFRDNGQEVCIFSLDLSYRDDTYFGLYKITYFSNGYRRVDSNICRETVFHITMKRKRTEQYYI